MTLQPHLPRPNHSTGPKTPEASAVAASTPTATDLPASSASSLPKSSRPTTSIANQKYISGYSQPLVFVISFSYQIPSLGFNKWMRAAVRGWTMGGILRYSSGLPIEAPTSNNSLNSLLLLNTGSGSAATFANRVSGQPLFLNNLNCHCFNPSTTFTLNPSAWVDPPAGQFGGPPYFSDYRYRRRPDESLSAGRIFKVKERYTFQLRAEFFNPFNRTYLNNPDSSNAAATQVTKNGQIVSGFGRINTGSTFIAPRNGQIVARFQ